MAVNLSPVGGVAAQFFTNTGAVLTGGKIYTYAAGTTTPAVTFTSSQGLTAWTNPIVLDAAGRVSGSGEIWLTDGINYKFVLKDSNDVLIATYDNISGINSNFVAYTNNQQIITATAGQTVFNLSISYQPGTNSLSVFVDGVNQYGPGAQYAYTETDSDTVTFVSGLHVGAEVKFTTTQQQGAGAVNASQVTYNPAGTGAVATNVQAKLRQYVSVIDFGADPTGSSDSATEIQAAIDYVQSTGGTLWFPPGIYLVGTQLDVAEEGMVFLGAGRDVTGTTTGTILRTTSAINLFSFTTAARRTTIQNMMLDGNSVGLTGADIATPKVQFINCTIQRFVDAGLIIRSFSTLVSECDVIENLGHGIWYNDENANQSRIFGGVIGGNAKNGVFVDTTLGYPNGIYIDGVDMENNCSAGDGTTNYAHIRLGGGAVGVYVSNMYHESDLTQTGYESQLYYNIGDGSTSVYLTNIKSNCSVGSEFDYHIRAGSAVQPLSIKNYWAGGVGTAIINNEVGASGALYTENVLEQNVSGFQSKLVDYAGAPVTAGTNLTNSPARLVAKVYPSANQTISSTSPATIQFNSVTFDPASMFSAANYGLDVREEGYYQVNARVSMTNYTVGEVAVINLRVGATTYDYSRVPLNIASSTITGEINTIVKCNAADRITVQIAKTTNNFDVLGNATYTDLSIVKVAQDSN
jgi:hypothetical protein